jgi:hypothetical protein
LSPEVEMIVFVTVHGVARRSPESRGARAGAIGGTLAPGRYGRDAPRRTVRERPGCRAPVRSFLDINCALPTV